MTGYHAKTDFPKGVAALSAGGAWARVLTGKAWDANAADAGIALLSKHRPARLGQADRYGWYYGSLVMHRRGGADWTAWRDQLGRTLTATQQQDGSWTADDKFGEPGGRLYTTALSLLALQSPHRYLTR